MSRLNASRRRALLVAAMLAFLAGCTSAAKKPASTASPRSDDPAQPVWLCRPNSRPDPCIADLDAEIVTASGVRSQQPAKAAPNPSFDCFYVYPTVSSQPGPNADLSIQPAETFTAESQAARFSTVCRVWAPVYRQVTTKALFTSGLSSLNTAYESLRSAWQYYLEHDNHGRPVIFIGHSQGAAMLIRLLASQVDPNPALRRRLVVAIVAGGNLQVPTGQTVGATFKHIPLCTSTSVSGCVIAYSTFGSQPSAKALFGRPGTGVSLMSLQLTSAGQQVGCVNPAALGGGTGNLSPYFLKPGAVPWTSYPGLYRAACRSADGATWLQVDAVKTPGDTRPLVPSEGSEWGYHGDDVNLTLGNLVCDVTALESAYSRQR
jgi:hypothetical protein